MIRDLSEIEWKTKARTFSFADGPLIMAILNVTPDSFSDGGRFDNLDSVLRQVGEFVTEGADIIDVGGESTRPKAANVPLETELERIAPVIAAIAGRFDVAISIDTYKSVVAKTALDCGAEIVNDISGFRFDPEMAGVAREGQAGVVLMHVRGTLETMHDKIEEEDTFKEVTNGLRWSVGTAREAGIEQNRICLDVGIGFGKTHSQNLWLLGHLSEIMSEVSTYPMLVGVSRKSFVGKIIGEPEPSGRLAGTIAANCAAVAAGANVLRVHDVKEAVDAAKVTRAIRNEI